MVVKRCVGVHYMTALIHHLSTPHRVWVHRENRWYLTTPMHLQLTQVMMQHTHYYLGLTFAILASPFKH